jgi:hypothetical protein
MDEFSFIPLYSTFSFQEVSKLLANKLTTLKHLGNHTVMMAVFWDVAPCSLVEVYQPFTGPCCLHHQGDEDRYIPEDSHLRTQRRENFKSY